jgi:predicted DNA-binding protein (MmcQ/YjbR family)
MASQVRARKRLTKLSEICLALPGAAREDKHDYSRFLVGKKIFAYYLNEHDPAKPGMDKIVSVCCKVLAGDNERLAQNDPRKFYLPPYIGSRGWVGLRLDLPRLDWSEVKDLVRGSYSQTAPAKFLKLL